MRPDLQGRIASALRGAIDALPPDSREALARFDIDPKASAAIEKLIRRELDPELLIEMAVAWAIERLHDLAHEPTGSAQQALH